MKIAHLIALAIALSLGTCGSANAMDNSDKIRIIKNLQKYIKSFREEAHNQETNAFASLLEAALSGDLEKTKSAIRAIEEGQTEQNPIKANAIMQYTSLTVACIMGHLDLVKFLLSTGVNVNMNIDDSDSSDDESSPLHIACISDNWDIATLLIEYKANVDAALHSLSNNIDYKRCPQNYPKIIKFLVNAGANIEARYKNGNTPLLDACLAGNKEVVNFLLSKKANIHAKNNWDETALHLACKKFDLDFVTLLLSKKININAKNRRGETVLHVACEEQNFELMAFLIRHGADLNLKGFRDYVPLLDPALHDFFIAHGIKIPSKKSPGKKSVLDYFKKLSPKNLFYNSPEFNDKIPQEYSILGLFYINKCIDKKALYAGFMPLDKWQKLKQAAEKYACKEALHAMLLGGWEGHTTFENQQNTTQGIFWNLQKNCLCDVKIIYPEQ
jgi:ankyrin repeat protein